MDDTSPIRVRPIPVPPWAEDALVAVEYEHRDCVRRDGVHYCCICFPRPCYVVALCTEVRRLAERAANLEAFLMLPSGSR